jgi:hypothetical protein
VVVSLTFVSDSKQQAGPSTFGGYANRAAFLFAGSVMLSWVALFNRAPLVFADTLSYSTAAFEREIPGLFSIFYSAFILPLHQGLTFWPVIFVQAAILSHLLYLTVRTVTHGQVGMRGTLAIIAALAIFSSLPWVVGEILPDVFAPVVLLGMFLIAFAVERLSRAERVYVWILTTFAIATHLSYVPIAAGLILVCIGIRTLVLKQVTGIRRWTAYLSLPLLIAVASMMAVNLASSQSLSLARNGNVFLLAKWIDEGPALAYLKDACPDASYKLCQHLGELEGRTHDELKWRGDSPFQTIGFDELEPEAKKIVWGTLIEHPLEIIRRALIDGCLQLSRFQAGEGLTREFANWVGEHVGKVYGPNVGRPFIESKQAHGELPIVELRQVHLIGLTIAAGLYVLLGFRLGSLTPELSLLCVFVFLGIIVSAAVTGALSGPYDRYLARIIWLACLVPLVGLFPLAQHQPRPFSEPKL